MEAKVYNIKGEEVGSERLPDNIFGLPWNADLVHQVILAEGANARVPYAHTKGRGEVRGGGKKPWRQKGTGRARHGSIRSPIWVGGGVTHGPTKDKNYSQKLNKKMQRKALLIALSQKARAGEVLILDSFLVDTPKTKRAAGVLKNLSRIDGFSKLAMKGGATLLVLPGLDRGMVRVTRNLPYCKSHEARNLNTRSVLTHRYLVVPKETILVLEKVFVNPRGSSTSQSGGKSSTPRPVSATKESTKGGVLNGVTA